MTICLDEMCWINLAKSQKQSLIEQIEKRINQDGWIIVLPPYNIRETANTGNDDARLAIWEMQKRLSKGFRVISDMREIEYFCFSKGVKPQSDFFVEQCGFSDKEFSFEPLSDLKKIGVSHFERQYENHKKQPYNNDYEFLVENFFDYPFSEEQKRNIVAKIKQIAEGENKNERRMIMMNFFRDWFPSFYVASMLFYDNLKRNQNGEFHKNDFIDVIMLASVIPYCDIVVTEKRWVDTCENKLKLNNLYNTEFYNCSSIEKVFA